jgi:hypothetical protein
MSMYEQRRRSHCIVVIILIDSSICGHDYIQCPCSDPIQRTNMPNISDYEYEMENAMNIELSVQSRNIYIVDEQRKAVCYRVFVSVRFCSSVQMFD